MTRLQGRLSTWNDDRGFGFIAADGSRKRLFVHIKSIGEIATRPRVGDRVAFTQGTSRDGRPAAHDVTILGANPRQRETERRGLPPPDSSFAARQVARLVLAVVLLGCVALAVGLGRAPALLGWAYLALGLLSGLNYWRDKRAAQAGTWRVTEASLQGLDLVGGIAGGLVAQALLRHKTSKPDFTLRTIGTAALHIGATMLLVAGLWDFPVLS